MRYLKCDKCGGYYELQKGESIADFDSCECGGNFTEVEMQNSDSKGIEVSAKFCKKCGTKNNENAKVCKECGQSFKKSVNKPVNRNIRSSKNSKSDLKGKYGKYAPKLFKSRIGLVAILAVLIIIIGIGANYAYGNYKMSQMNNYMKQSQQYSDEAYDLSNEAQSFVNQTDYNNAISDIDQAVDDMNQAQKLAGQAYGYADGPYKEVIDADIHYNEIEIDFWTSWKKRLEYVQSGNSVQAAELKQQENSRVADQQKYSDEISTTLNQNPGMEEYIKNNW